MALIALDWGCSTSVPPITRSNDTSCGCTSWYYNPFVKSERQKKNPHCLNPDTEVRIFFDARPVPKKESFKRTSRLTVSRV